MNYKIIASDLDGTLLNEKVTVSEENVKAIIKTINFIIKKNICFNPGKIKINNSNVIKQIEYIIIEEICKRQGIGTKLLKELEKNM